MKVVFQVSNIQWLSDLASLIQSTIVFSTALIFAALGGVFSERSGVVNIGLEGLMVIGAFSSAVVTYFVADATGGAAYSPWIGLLAAVLLGILFSLLHAVASVTFNADQVVSGVAINFLALGFSIFMVMQFFDGSKQTKTLSTVFSKVEIPLLSDIPYIGKALFILYPTSIIAFFIVFLAWYLLYKTPFGLRLRSVGEHPAAADTLGINVSRMRYIAVMFSGALAALGGATITLTTSGNFAHNTVSGQGFIALAAMIFGKWHPVGAMWAALFFGIAQGLNSILQIYGWTQYIPTDFVYMFPYILTILVLAGFVGKAEAPAADGQPYIKGQ